MTLRWKTLLLMGAMLSVALLLLWAVMRGVLLESFERTEARQMRLVAVDAAGAVEDFGDNLHHKFLDWSNWDDAYQYVSDGNQAFEESNLTDAAIGLLDVDFITLLDARDRPVFATFWDRDRHQRSPLPAEISAYWKAGSPLLELPRVGSVQKGIFEYRGDPMQVVALPIHNSHNAGARRGTLIVGSAPRDSWLSAQNRNNNSQLSIVRFDALAPDAQLSLRTLAGAPQLPEVEKTLVVPRDERTVMGYHVVRGFYGRALWAIRVESRRVTVIQGRATLQVFGFVLFITGLAACVMALLPVESLVLRRLSQLSSDVQNLRLTGGHGQRVRAQGKDELGRLASDINATLWALEVADGQRARSQQLHQEMAEAALAAGDCFFVANVPTSSAPASSAPASGAPATGEVGDAQIALEWRGNIAKLLGLQEGESPRTLAQWRDYVHPEDWELLRYSYELAWSHGVPFSLEVRVRRSDGYELFWQHRGKLLSAATDNANGDEETPAKLLGMCLDITARKTAERARRRTETRLMRIAETAADAIMLYDAKGQIIFANAAAARVFGRPIEELWSLSYDAPQWGDATLDGAPLPMGETVFRRVERERQPVYEMQYQVQRPNGEIVALSVNATPLPEERGTFGGVVASFSDITQRRQMEERLNHQAFHDPLTGLANRTLIQTRLRAALEGQREGDQIAVLFIDLDNFKWVNDSLGHDKGDVLLCEVAERLQKTTRAGDTPARFGGDEFVVLLSGIQDPNYAFAVAERIVTLLSEAFVLSGREVYTSPSIGLAFSQGGSDADTLLRHADAAMYEAKRRGKGRYEVFRDNLSAAALARLEIEGDLRRAISAEEMGLAYQPKVDMESGAICGIEALVRWEHPQRGTVSPTEFIPIAEATGLVVPLGRWVLREACRQTHQWNHDREVPLVVAVNVSPRQFHSGVAAGTGTANSETTENRSGLHLELVRDVAAALHETGLPPHLLTLEITETVLMERTSESLEVLTALSNLGVQLAIDDFGTGYSSLAYLRTFPFDFLKIDREFVAKIDQAQGHSVIVRAIIQLAHTLGLKVIAEGAEVVGEIEVLQDFGCDQAQGYFYARPLPPDELEKLLAAENLIGK